MLHLLNKRLEELTDAEIQAIFDRFQLVVKIDDTFKDALTALLKGESIHTVADLAGSPQAIQKVIAFVQNQPAQSEKASVVVQCPHCKNFFIREFG